MLIFKQSGLPHLEILKSNSTSGRKKQILSDGFFAVNNLVQSTLRSFIHPDNMGSELNRVANEGRTKTGPEYL
jgi:hypothetical protein